MGQSTDAILVWGFELPDPEDDDKLGDRISHLEDEGWDEMKELQKTGAEVVRHCSCDCPMYILGVTKTKVRAGRGHPQEIASLVVDVTEGQTALDAFAKGLGVESQPGKWILASDWC